MAGTVQMSSLSLLEDQCETKGKKSISQSPDFTYGPYEDISQLLHCSCRTFLPSFAVEIIHSLSPETAALSTWLP